MNTLRRRVAAATVLVAALVAALETGTSSASVPALPGRPITWLAAGDSYSSGEGLPHSTGGCAKADGTQSRAWAQEAHDNLTASGKITTSKFDFVACTGALTDQFFHPQGDNPAEWDGHSKYNLVTFTFGGDDVGFPHVIKTCLINRLAPIGINLLATDFDPAAIPANTRVGPTNACPNETDLRADILRVGNNYRGFLEQVIDNAVVTGGNVLVLGYPELIEDPNQWGLLSKATALCSGVAPADANELRGLAGALNQALGNAVSIVNDEHRNNVTLKFLDVNSGGSLGIDRSDARLFEPSAGARHDVCSSDSRMNGISSIDYFMGSYHPKQEGLDNEASMVTQVLTTQMDWSAAQPAPAPSTPAPTQQEPAPETQAPVAQTPANPLPNPLPTYTTPGSTTPSTPPSTPPASDTPSNPPSTPPSTDNPPPPARTGIISYDHMAPGAPFYGRATKGWQEFTAASNTITQIGVTWSNPNDAPGQPVDGAQTRISLCTGLDPHNTADPCAGRIADTSVTVVNQGETTANFDGIPVTIGATYYLFYYQPDYQAGQWDFYWWNCPTCVGRRNNSQLSDQNQAVVRGYNQ